MVVGALNDGQFRRLCGAVGEPSWADDSRFASNPLRVRHRDELLELLQGRLETDTTQHWEATLSAVQVPCAPINDMAGVFSDPQVQHLGMVQEIEHKAVGTAPLRLTSPAVVFGGTPASLRLPPPMLGEHTREVLAETAGYSSSEIDRLQEAGVIFVHE